MSNSELERSYPMNLRDYARKIDQICEEHGWNEDRYKAIRRVLVESGNGDLCKDLPVGKSEAEWAILAVSEIVEAFEEHRDGQDMVYLGPDGKPEGLAVEYADALIRILHWFERNGLNPDEIVHMKMEYNEGRPYRHGGKKV